MCEFLSDRISTLSFNLMQSEKHQINSNSPKNDLVKGETCSTMFFNNDSNTVKQLSEQILKLDNKDEMKQVM